MGRNKPRAQQPLYLILPLLLVIIMMMMAGVKGAYSDNQQQQYLDAFPTLINQSYSAPRPAALNNECAGKREDGINWATINTVIISQNTDAAGLQDACGTKRYQNIINNIMIILFSAIFSSFVSVITFFLVFPPLLLLLLL